MTLPFLHSGLQLLKTYCASGRTFSSGIPELDRLLAGGVNSGQVMEIIGQSQTGKTHLCHALTAHVAASHPPTLGHRVLYLDCAGQFSIARLLRFVDRECRNEKESGDTEEFHVAQTMRRVFVSRCLNLEELLEGFEILLQTVKCGTEPMQKVENMPELIVIDSLASAFSLMPLSSMPDDAKTKEIEANKQKMERLMAKLSIIIPQAAYFANIAIVVTNPVPVPQLLYSGSYYNAWTSAPHVRLFLELPPPPEAMPSSCSASRLQEVDKERRASFQLQRRATLRHHSGSRYSTAELSSGDLVQFSTWFTLP